MKKRRNFDYLTDDELGMSRLLASPGAGLESTWLSSAAIQGCGANSSDFRFFFGRIAFKVRKEFRKV
jgi:hypothetical protein